MECTDIVEPTRFYCFVSRSSDWCYFARAFPREKPDCCPRSGSGPPLLFLGDLDLYLDLETRSIPLALARAFPLFAVKRTSVSGNGLALSHPIQMDAYDYLFLNITIEK